MRHRHHVNDICTPDSRNLLLPPLSLSPSDKPRSSPNTSSIAPPRSSPPAQCRLGLAQHPASGRLGEQGLRGARSSAAPPDLGWLQPAASAILSRHSTSVYCSCMLPVSMFRSCPRIGLDRGQQKESHVVGMCSRLLGHLENKVA